MISEDVVRRCERRETRVLLLTLLFELRRKQPSLSLRKRRHKK
jgi:hypothetical protein